MTTQEPNVIPIDGINVDNADELCEAYVLLRDRKAAIKAEFDAKVMKVDGKMAWLEFRINDILRKHNVDSLKTGHGTAYRSTKVLPVVSDWEQVRNWAYDHRRLDIFQARLSNKVVAEIFSSDTSNPQPLPGCALMTEEVIAVRRPNAN